ncbi:MAG: hypothetical protein QW689_07020, partial [Nitrososphaerota archaeon]
SPEEKPESREVSYELAKDFESISSKYRDSILKWASGLNIGSIEELRELLEKRKKEIQQSKRGTE